MAHGWSRFERFQSFSVLQRRLARGALLAIVGAPFACSSPDTGGPYATTSGGTLTGGTLTGGTLTGGTLTGGTLTGGTLTGGTLTGGTLTGGTLTGGATSTSGAGGVSSSQTGGTVTTQGSTLDGGQSVTASSTTGDGSTADGSTTSGTQTATSGGGTGGQGSTADVTSSSSSTGAGGAATSATGSSTTGGQTCPLPSSFQWTSTGPLAQPSGSGWHSLKDFTVTKHNGNYIVYGTVNDGNWNGFFSIFSSFDQWATAEQHYHAGHVAPALFYFEPKDIWVLTYQWGFQYKTTSTPDVWSSWSSGSPLISGDPTNGAGTGPIDQTVICDDTTCYIFFNDDAGGVYRGSMPVNDFPGTFTNSTRIMQEATSIIFEGIQVYSIKGSDQYLMIIENNGTRHFKAWTSNDLGGTWTPLSGADSQQSPFAGQANTTWSGGQWTNDISHGDIVRENPSEKMEIDPCNLRLLYQGRDPNVNVPYGELPYRPGLLTLVP